MSWKLTRDMIAPQDQQALDAFEDRKRRCEAYYKFIEELRTVDNILEIGARCGYCARAMLEAAPLAKYVGIDKSREWLSWWELLTTGFSATFILAESRDILPFLRQRQFDIVHVDGDHSIIGAAHDISYAAKLVRDDGVVIVDDAEAYPVQQAIQSSGLLVMTQTTVSDVKNTGQLSLAFTVKQ